MSAPHGTRARLAFALVPLFLCAFVCRASSERVPRFKDYSVKSVYRGKNARPVWTRDARNFKTRLGEAARRRPNFAGRYIVTTWGCGTGCDVGAVIDAKTGRVSWFPSPVGWDYEAQAEFRPVEFRLDSRLIIFSGFRVDRDEGAGARFYKFERGRFVFLKFIKREEAR